MLRKPHFLILLLAVLMAFVGCSDDPTAPRGETASIIKGTMSTDQPAFAYVVERANHPENPRPGPFILQGSNLHYDDSFGALVVDLTVTHAGVDVYYEPVSITFLDLLPEGVTVFDPPGGEPTFEFEFTNDDAMWTPGEKSLPLTVAFVVEPETSISFTAEIGIGFGPDSGLISGVVWEDLNGNGVREENENGVGGVPVILIDGNIDPRLPIAHPRAITGPEGNYSFPGLLAGTYTVKVEPQPFITQVTPAERHVLLTETSGGVGTFEGADFGVVIVPIEQN
ncbi:MAG: SdrD B-like domain-containing protein, partial [Candidatus Krumholzibacteriota bacterium]